MTKFYTYIYRDPTKNNEPFYVGKGCKNRARQHLSKSDSYAMNLRIAAIRYQGEQPVIEIIEAVDEAAAYQLEGSLVAKYGRIDLGTGPLLNKSNGGTPGPKGAIKPQSAIEATRSKAIGRPNPNKGKPGPEKTPEWLEKIRTANTGKKRTPEQIAAMKEARKGKLVGFKHSAESRANWSKAAKNRPKVTCEHCGFVGQKAGMSRFHFDNCKQKPPETQ